MPSTAWEGGRATPIAADVTDSSEVADLFESAMREFGGVDILVNNAGIYPNADFLTMSGEQWDAMMQINLKGTFLCAQAAARTMIEGALAVPS